MFSPPSGHPTTMDIGGEGPSASKPARAHDTRLFPLGRIQESSFEDFWTARDKAGRYPFHPDFVRCSYRGDCRLLENICWTIAQSRHLKEGSIRGEREIALGRFLRLNAPPP